MNHDQNKGNYLSFCVIMKNIAKLGIYKQIVAVWSVLNQTQSDPQRPDLTTHRTLRIRW